MELLVSFDSNIVGVAGNLVVLLENGKIWSQRGGKVIELQEKPITVSDLAEGTGSQLYLAYTVHDRDANGGMYKVCISRLDPITFTETVLILIPIPTSPKRVHWSSEDQMGQIPSVKLVSVRNEDADRLLVVIGAGSHLDQQQVQNDDTLLGKAILLDTDGSGRFDLFAVGFRNPQSVSRSADGMLTVVDDGFYEQKVDILRDGANYGWNIKAGEVLCYPLSDICRPNVFPVPAFQVANERGVRFGGGCALASTRTFYLPQNGQLTSVPITGTNWKGSQVFPIEGGGGITRVWPSTETSLYVAAGKELYTIHLH